jgi:DNA polymerase III gamma/tau subunit
MHSFIISSKDTVKALGEAEKINLQNKVDKFDIETTEFEKALGIEDVRNIQKKIFLKPLRGEKKTNILMLQNGVSIEAQNSMLKLLEEPPLSSIIILITENYHIFLPTILSRCKLIDLDKNTTLQTIDKKEYSYFFESLRIKDEGSALKLAQDLSKDKKDALDWLEKAIFVMRQEMLNNLQDIENSQKIKEIIEKLSETRNDLKNTNVNTRLALENLFLNI